MPALRASSKQAQHNRASCGTTGYQMGTSLRLPVLFSATRMACAVQSASNSAPVGAQTDH